MNDTQKQQVEIVKAKINDLQRKQNELYDALGELVDIDNSWLFDYVFNCGDDDEYTETVREHLFDE